MINIDVHALPWQGHIAPALCLLQAWCKHCMLEPDQQNCAPHAAQHDMLIPSQPNTLMVSPWHHAMTTLPLPFWLM